MILLPAQLIMIHDNNAIKICCNLGFGHSSVVNKPKALVCDVKKKSVETANQCILCINWWKTDYCYL